VLPPPSRPRGAAPSQALLLVLKITPLRAADAASYYLEAVASGGEDYYVRNGEAPGAWVGRGARGLGLEGVVRPDHLGALLRQEHPLTGENLAARRIKRAGFDLTLSAPKSVSLLWALGPSEAATAALGAHHAGVRATVAYLEGAACHVRRGGRDGYGVRQEDGHGLIGAAFTHFTSRALDPQVHTHVLIVNLAQGSDGRYTALDGTDLFTHRRAAGYLYQAVLRDELRRRLGVGFEPVHKGAAEVAGISASARRQFSKRRIAIEQHLRATGASGERAAEQASLKTRAGKDHSIELDELRGRWRQEAARAGINVHWIPAAVARPALPTDGDVARALTDDSATFTRADVVAAVAAGSTDGATRERIEELAEQFLTGPHAAALSHGRWTTAEMLAIETGAIDASLRRRGTGAATATTAATDTILAAIESLSDEQQRMVCRICTSGDGVEIVVGAPGSGKTLALGAARRIWRTDGIEVIGCALAARAAAGLEADSGIPSTTIARLLLDIEQGRRPLTDRTVVVCDEAAMVGTRDLARLVDLTDRAGAKLVLVGDPKQLPPIEAGGLYPALRARLGVSELVQNRRQRDPDERRLSADLRAGHTTEAIARLDRIGRLTTDTDPDRLLDRMVDHWSMARADGHDVVMLSLTRDGAAQLNQRARATLIPAGALGDVVATIEETGLDFRTGDTVVCLRNDRRLGIRNGDVAVVRASTDELLLIDTERGPVELPATYLAAGHLDHGYALTVHKAQGATYDVALLLGDHYVYAEAGYTALTRGRTRNHAYVLVDEGADLSRGEQLRRRLERTGGTPAAIDVQGSGLA
jgi:conjugative relaxase-like TrwC/TraI family protein